MNEPEQPNPEPALGVAKGPRKTGVDEYFEVLEKISAEHFDNPKIGIHLLIHFLKEKAIKNRELESKLESAVSDKGNFSNHLAVAQEKLRSKDVINGIVTVFTAIGGILVALASSGSANFAIGTYDISKIIFIIGFVLMFSSPIAFLFEKKFEGKR